MSGCNFVSQLFRTQESGLVKVWQRAAGYVRNQEMAEYADGLVASWDGKSKGTAMMIELAMERNLATQVILVSTP